LILNNTYDFNDIGELESQERCKNIRNGYYLYDVLWEDGPRKECLRGKELFNYYYLTQGMVLWQIKKKKTAPNGNCSRESLQHHGQLSMRTTKIAGRLCLKNSRYDMKEESIGERQPLRGLNSGLYKYQLLKVIWKRVFDPQQGEWFL